VASLVLCCPASMECLALRMLSTGLSFPAPKSLSFYYLRRLAVWLQLFCQALAFVHSPRDKPISLSLQRCEVGVVKWVRYFTMAEVLGPVQPPNVPQTAPRRVVGKPALGAHPRATVLSARGPRRTSQNGACTSPHKSPPELTPAESAQYETNKSSTHKYKTYNKCIG